jgi:uncharacterized protein YvpB
MLLYTVLLSAFLTTLLALLLLFNVIKEGHRSKIVILTFLCFCWLLYSFIIYTEKGDVIRELTKRKWATIEAQMVNGEKTIIEAPLQVSKILDVPIISQLPELPRGCEVTSLAMLLQFKGIEIDKMELAKQIRKDTTPYQVKEGKVYFGHPNEGFVGDMYNLDEPGLGVYHKPIMELAEKFLPNQVVDLTGSDFSELERSLSKGLPVWVIINSRYKELPSEEFRVWDTPKGKVTITYREHSVVMTGYDREYIYFNDPLTGEKNKKTSKQNFIDAWVQMGKQAISFYV